MPKQNESIQQPIAQSPEQMPEGMPAMQPGLPAGGDDFRGQVEQELEGVENKEREFNTQKLINENDLKQVRSEMLRTVFDALQRAGVDLSDRESIGKFMQKLQEQDPDLAELFGMAMDKILNETGGGEVPQAPPTTPPMGQLGMGQGPMSAPPMDGGGMMPAPPSPPAVMGENSGMMDKYSNLSDKTLQ